MFATGVKAECVIATHTLVYKFKDYYNISILGRHSSADRVATL